MENPKVRAELPSAMIPVSSRIFSLAQIGHRDESGNTNMIVNAVKLGSCKLGREGRES